MKYNEVSKAAVERVIPMASLYDLWKKHTPRELTKIFESFFPFRLLFLKITNGQSCSWNSNLLSENTPISSWSDQNELSVQ